MRVAMCARSEARLHETAAAIARETGAQVVAIPADLRSLAGCEGFVEAAAARPGGVSKELSMELGPLNIRVNSVAPGRIQTARADRLLQASAASQGTSPGALLEQLVGAVPSGRLGTIEDIAEAVCFLVSARASYINGAALVVDGSKSLVI